MSAPRPEVAAELQQARRIINRVARSFSLAARLLPRQQRHDAELLYLVLRTLDDLVDIEVRAGGSTREAAESRMACIEAWTRGEPLATTTTNRELLILNHLAGQHAFFPRDAVRDFLDGMRSDLAPSLIATDEDATRYCYQVAGTVGRLMAAILGVKAGRAREADQAARALGIAMQRTNILRDIDEDLVNGRIYLSEALMRRHGFNPEAASGPTSLRDGDRHSLLREEILRADAAYDEGLAGVHYLQHGRRSIRAAALLYREILRQIERDGFGTRRPHRAVVGRVRKVALIARAAIGG